MCGSLYLPIFLFRDGSLTLIRIAFFDGSHIALVLSATNTETVNGYIMTSGVVMFMNG